MYIKIKKIILTKKSKYLLEKKNTYVFLVSPELNKCQIKKEILDIFSNIKIEKICTSINKPSTLKSRFSRKLPGKHFTKLKKKAFVQLYSDSEPISLEIFDKSDEKKK